MQTPPFHATDYLYNRLTFVVVGPNPQPMDNDASIVAVTVQNDRGLHTAYLDPQALKELKLWLSTLNEPTAQS